MQEEEPTATEGDSATNLTETASGSYENQSSLDDGHHHDHHDVDVSHKPDDLDLTSLSLSQYATSTTDNNDGGAWEISGCGYYLLLDRILVLFALRKLEETDQRDGFPLRRGRFESPQYTAGEVIVPPIPRNTHVSIFLTVRSPRVARETINLNALLRRKCPWLW